MSYGPVEEMLLLTEVVEPFAGGASLPPAARPRCSICRNDARRLSDGVCDRCGAEEEDFGVR